MELLKKRIEEQGKIIGTDVVKVDMFLNLGCEKSETIGRLE